MHLLIIISSVAIVAIALLMILIYLLNSNKNNFTKIANNKKMEYPKVKVELKKISLQEMNFPKNIEKMNQNAISQACRVILDSYKALNYVEKLPSAMDRIEWHTWQVSLLLQFLKMKNRLSVFNKEKFFHQQILEMDAEYRRDEMQKILNKYLDNANIGKDRDTLSKDVIWNAREVSIILFEILQDK